MWTSAIFVGSKGADSYIEPNFLANSGGLISSSAYPGAGFWKLMQIKTRQSNSLY